MIELTRSESLEEKLDAVARAGSFRSKEEVVSQALTALLAHDARLRIGTAVELYRQGHVTRARGAEIAGLEWEAFQSLLTERNVSTPEDNAAPEDDAAGVRAGAERIRALRQSP